MMRLLLTLFLLISPAAWAYEPRQLLNPVLKPVYLSLQDTERNRALPLKVYLPDISVPAPVILLSHGLGGSREVGTYLGQYWAGRGYVVVALQHPGSDESVWRDASNKLQGIRQLKAAANPENLLLRIQDVRITLDALTKWNADKTSPLHARLDMSRVGMSGHSYGAHTTQAVAGQSFPQYGNRFTDSRIDAALPLSPAPPARGSVAEAFAKVKIPWLLMTGTEDDSPIGHTTPERRREVFKALPPGDKYELVLNGATHSAFGDVRRKKVSRNPDHHPAIQAISTAFWDAYLQGDEKAKAWLQAPPVINPADSWQTK